MKHGENDVEQQISIQGIHLSVFLIMLRTEKEALTKCGFWKCVDVHGSFDVVTVNPTVLTHYKHK